MQTFFCFYLWLLPWSDEKHEETLQECLEAQRYSQLTQHLRLLHAVKMQFFSKIKI